MALRFICEYYGDGDRGGDRMRIEIHDSLGGPGGDFCSAGDGAVIRQEGNTRDVYQRIFSSSCSFDFLIDHRIPTHLQFIEDLALAEEDRFHTVVKRGGVDIFRGMLVIDEIQIQDNGRDLQWISLNWTDGLADLQNIPYALPSGALFPGTQQVDKHMANIFSLWTARNLFIGVPVFLETEIFAVEMTDLTASPWEQAFLNNSAFRKKSREKETPLTCYEVLTQILSVWDAYIYTAGESIHIRSWNLLASSGAVSRFRYHDIGMGSYTHERVSIDTITACQDDYKALAGGVMAFMSPLRLLSVSYTHGGGGDWLFGVTTRDIEPGEECYPLDDFPVFDDEIRFRITGTIRVFMHHHGQPINDPVLFQVIFTVKSAAAGFDQEFRVTLDKEIFDPTPFPNATYNLSQEIEFLSSVLPPEVSGEDMELCIRYRIINQDEQDLSVVDYPTHMNFDAGSLQFVTEEDIAIEDVSETYTIINSVRNNRHASFGILIGDGPVPDGNTRIMVRSSTPAAGFDPTSAWQDHATGLGPFTHTEFLARSMMARRMGTLWVKEGLFLGYITQGSRLSYKGKMYAPVLYQYSSGRHRFGGEYIALSVGDASGLAMTRVEEDAQRPGGSSGGSGGPGAVDIHARPEVLYFMGPLSSAAFDYAGILGMGASAQAQRVHAWRNGNKMRLDSAGSGPFDFQIMDVGGSPAVVPAVPLTPNDRLELNIFK